MKDSDIVPNQQKRQMYKNFMNSTVGKFSQRSSYANTSFVTSAQDIEHILQEQSINDFSVLGEDVCEVQTKNVTSPSPCRKTNPVIGSFVTALSRIDMHKHIIALKNKGFLPHYTDTDSLIFSGDTTKDIPLPISQNFGDFRKEYSDPSAFCCIGKKNYAIALNVEDRSNQNRNPILKVRGLSLTGKNAQAVVNFATFEHFLQKKSQTVTSIPQMRLKKSKSFEVSHKITHVKLATDLNFNRILTKSPHFTTLPYGYVE